MEKLSRRNLFRLLITAPLAATGIARAKAAKSANAELASGLEISQSFDARDWARHFVQHVRAIPSIATDEGTMVSWFASAIMRGYDEARRSSDDGWKQWRVASRRIDELVNDNAALTSETHIRQAVAQGWCSPKNSHKEMDVDLAEAIVQKVLGVQGTRIRRNGV